MCMHMHARALLGAHACALAGWRIAGVHAYVRV